MRIDAFGGTALRFGVDGSRCWRRDRQLALSCSDGDRRQNAQLVAVLEARALHRLDPGHLILADRVDWHGHPAPAMRAGELLLVFDPATHRLVEIRYDDQVETFSDFRDVQGALVAAHRVLTIDGTVDVDETWQEIVPGGADPAALQPSAPMQNGVTIEDVDPIREIVWTEVSDLEADARRGVEALDAFARAHNFAVSTSDGVVFTPLGGSERPDGPRWQLAITLEGGASVVPSREGNFHLDVWPPVRMVGVFHRGDPRASEEKSGLIERLIARRGLVRVAGSRLQILCGRESLLEPLDRRVSLLRLAVETSGNLVPSHDAATVPSGLPTAYGRDR